MSPITVRAEADSNSDVSETYEAASLGVKKELRAEEPHFHVTKGEGQEEEEEEAVKAPSVKHLRKGSAKFDAAIQAFAEHDSSTNGNHRGVNHRPPPSLEEDQSVGKREGRRNNSRNSHDRRASEESVRSSSGRRSGDGGSRKSFDGGSNRKSTDSQRSNSSEKVSCEDSSDQLAQITDILLARLITTLSDSTLGNPALLLQTLLGFSPDDYSDLLAALSESHLSYVDIISAYLHNIRVMSEDSGSTSAALSGTLTRSLIEQYNSLLAQAVKSPQSIARANMISEADGRSQLADLLQKANTSEIRQDKRAFEALLPKGPSGLGFGRRHSADANKQRQNFLTGTTATTTGAGAGAVTSDNLQKPVNQAENGLLDLAKFFHVTKMQNPNVNATSTTSPNAGNSANGLATTTTTNTATSTTSNIVGGAAATVAAPPPPTLNTSTVGNYGGMTPDQLTALLQSAGMIPNGGGGGGGAPLYMPNSFTAAAVAAAANPVQGIIPSMPFLPHPTTQLPLNGMMATAHPYSTGGLPPMQPWISTTLPVQQQLPMQPWISTTLPVQQQLPMQNRNMWQGPSPASNGGACASTGNMGAGGNGQYASFRGWGSGLETVPENFNSPLQLYQDQQSCFPAAINMQQPSQQ